MLNVYNSLDHIAGVGDVVAADISDGLDLIEDCLTEHGLAPAFVAAPGWTDESTVRTAIQADTSCYGGVFPVLAVIDGDDTETDHSAVATTATAITTQNCAFAWPDHYDIPSSNWYIGAAMKACNDADKGDGIPFWPPANISTSQTYSDTDTKVSKEEADALNAAGVTTFLRKPGTSVPDLWNHRLLHYNAGEDDYLKDTYGPQMMSNYINRVMFSFLYEKLSAPINIRQVNAVLTGLNNLLENLKAKGALVGAKVEFLESDNTVAELSDISTDKPPWPH
jgi:phage tail sheath protein FI